MVIPEHLKGLVTDITPLGAYICLHGRQLTICAVCGVEAERRLVSYRLISKLID